MSGVPAVNVDDREAALGKLFRGIAHETANTLNAVLMNAQLGMLSAEEAPASLETIASQARSGGQFIKQISAFSGGADMAPTSQASLGDSIGLARKLIGTRMRRSGLNLTIEASDAPKLPLDSFGAAVTIALMLDAACNAGASRAVLRTAVGDLMCELRLMTEAAGQVDDTTNSLALRFAHQLARDHSGRFQTLPDGWRLELPLGTDRSATV